MGLLLTVSAVVFIAVRAEEIPQVVNFWPLGLAAGVAVVGWGLQGFISAVIAHPRIKSLRVPDMTYIYLVGAFVGGISPVRGAEIPVEVILLRRLGLSAGEGSTVMISKGILNASVVFVGSIVALIVTRRFPKVEGANLIVAALVLGGVWALAAFLWRRRSRRAAERARRTETPAAHHGWRKKVAHFFRDMWSSFALLWRREHRMIVAYAVALTMVYWAVRLSLGPLALMAGGYSGDWVPVVVAQLLLTSFVLPFTPTPGASGAAELGFAALLTAYVPDNQLLNGVVIWRGLTHYLPVLAGALFASRYVWQSISSPKQEDLPHDPPR